MEQNESVKKNSMLTCLYGPMYLQLDDYPPYSGKNSEIFETHININLRCIHGYINCMRHTDLITWVSNSAVDFYPHISGLRLSGLNPPPRSIHPHWSHWPPLTTTPPFHFPILVSLSSSSLQLLI